VDGEASGTDSGSAAGVNVTAKVWAEAGELITCVNGHIICRMARTIHVGDARQSDHFTDWTQPEPKRSDHVADLKCKRCRGVWIRGNPRDGYAFHFSDGWR
jgi:hypothetical protein